jgi:hypothetical protein
MAGKHWIAHISVSRRDRVALEASSPLGLAPLTFTEAVPSPTFEPDDEPVNLSFAGVMGGYSPEAVDMRSGSIDRFAPVPGYQRTTRGVLSCRRPTI